MLVLALVGAACGTSTNNSSATTTTKAATVPSSAANGASPGITSSQVTLGNVSILSGPVPGLFQGAPDGVKAFFNYVNTTQGGVYGRKLVLRSADDQFSCTTNQSLTQSLVSQVFAFVGSFSLFDNCGAAVLRQNPQVPDVAYSLDPVAQALPNNFSPQPLQNGWRTGPLLYYKKHYPSAVRAVGTLVSNVPSSVASWNNEKAAMRSLGYNIVYDQTINPLTTDFSPYIAAMQQAGVKLLTLTNVDITRLALILNAAQQQGWHPMVLSAGGTAYDARLFTLTHPGAAEGLLNDQQQALYLPVPDSDASTTPEVKLFDEWMAKTNPGFSPDIFSVFAWASARLFVQALQAAGPNPTQASVMAALRNIHSFDSNGLLAPGDPADKKAPHCWVLIKVIGHKFVRYDSPATGFRCDGSYFQNTSSSGG
ncbi:MAG TPA: ABC transporter substrate-binding protein [Acidimicrobiales bacterium]|nr:ABC transporter substrate-binding protein [Acidimicrobiales bacterium]